MSHGGAAEPAIGERLFAIDCPLASGLFPCLPRLQKRNPRVAFVKRGWGGTDLKCKTGYQTAVNRCRQVVKSRGGWLGRSLRPPDPHQQHWPGVPTRGGGGPAGAGHHVLAVRGGSGQRGRAGGRDGAGGEPGAGPVLKGMPIKASTSNCV